ncbi:hypothetical protein TI05_05770 [Achromatium sp. WMS3]|nr:hypothetical protein TI05_05770 [Achromatium sp. WMS3]
MQYFFSLETYIDTDGVLHLNMPVSIKNTNVKVTVSYQPLSRLEKESTQQSFWNALQQFRTVTDLENLGDIDDIFANLRDTDPGRPIDL